MSNPYHVVLNRQSSGERGAWKRMVTIESEAKSNDTESHGDGDDTMETTAKTETTEMTAKTETETTALNKITPNY